MLTNTPPSPRSMPIDAVDSAARRSTRPAVLHPRRGRHRRSPEVLAMYRRRRLGAVVLAALAVVAIAAAAALPAGPGGVPAVAAGPAPAPSSALGPERSVHVAHRGDTLWAIAHQYRGAVDHDAYLDALIGLNGGTRIEAGQAVQLP